MRTVWAIFFAAACAMGLARGGFGADIEQRGLRTVSGGRDETMFTLRDEGERIRFTFTVRDATPCARPEILSERELEKFDRVEIYFSPTPDLSRSYYCAEVDPYGHVLDYHVDVPGKFVFDWSFSTIVVNAERSDGGYAVEGSVAKSELRTLGVNPDRCWIGVFRADFRTEGDVAGWYSAVPFGSGRPNFHQPKMFFARSAADGREITAFRAIPGEVGGRKVDAWWQPGEKDRDEPNDVRNLVLVKHPVAAEDGVGCPLYVVLHSAGHDALMALRCTGDVHNHDIYTAPDGFYGLYLDCRANSASDWWWGADGKKGFEETACEKRVVATVREVVERYAIDPNRVYLCGNSMGGSGTLGIGFRHGDVFAAIKANVPAIRRGDHPFKSLGLPPYELPCGARIPDPPPLVDYSAQNDGWSDNHERLIRAMKDRRYAWFFYWGAFGHADNDPEMLSKNDLIHSLDWLSVRLDEPYPVFTNASTDNVPPWLADRSDPKPGQVNGFFRWSDACDDASGVRLTLYLDPALKSRLFTVPETSVVDVTLRRVRRFGVNPGETVRWTFGGQSGEVATDGEGLMTFPRLRLTKVPQALSVERVAR